MLDLASRISVVALVVVVLVVLMGVLVLVVKEVEEVNLARLLVLAGATAQLRLSPRSCHRPSTPFTPFTPSSKAHGRPWQSPCCTSRQLPLLLLSLYSSSHLISLRRRLSLPPRRAPHRLEPDPATPRPPWEALPSKVPAQPRSPAVHCTSTLVINVL